MKKILIITYYWPPKGGVGVQRWLKLTKYLCKYNYEPIIYTPEDGFSPLEDQSLVDTISPRLTILKTNIFEPQKIFSFLFRKKVKSDILIRTKKSWLDKVFVWLRSNFCIPDSRSFWIQPSIKFLNKYIEKNPIDLIISTGPPHSMHMIAFALKKQHQINWIADFRDPWTGIEYFKQLPLLSFVKKRHINLEYKILSNADLTLSVSPSWAKQLSDLGAKKTAILTNGYDSEDYQINNVTVDSNKFTIGHFGLYNELRDHDFLWKTIKEIVKHKLDFSNKLQFLFAGEIHADFFMKIKTYQFDQKLIYHEYLNHANSIQYMMQCDLLLVTQGDAASVNGRLPAKFFEYLRARRPILAIGKKNSDLDKIIQNISYAWFVDFDNSTLLHNTILQIYELSKQDNIFDDDITEFSRESQAQKLIDLINDL
tara:strand:- start:67750 stop:69024 length:1275 start_codon:yes stop_codon:yes gene_type:complete